MQMQHTPTHAPPRFVRFFTTSLLFALTAGTGLGACMLANMTLPWNLLHGLPLDSAKLMHGSAQVFGFACLFIMGVAYHVVPRFAGVPLAGPRLAAAVFWLQTAGVMLVVLSAAAGASAPAGRLSGRLLLLTAALFFGWSIHRTLAACPASAVRFEAYLRAGCVWLVAATALGLASAATADTTLRPAMWDAALWGFTASWLFGMSLRILPVFMGVPAAPVRGAQALFAGYQAAVAAWVAVDLIDVWRPFPGGRAAAGAVLALAAVALVWRLGIFGRRIDCEADRQGYAKFVVTGYAWLLIALLFAPGWSLLAGLRGEGTPSLLLDFGRHAFTLGFLSQMIIGVSMRVVPAFTGAPLWSPLCREASYYLLNLAVAARGLQAVVELGNWEAPWPFIALSGPLGWGAFAAFALNVAMTVRAGRAPQRGAPATRPASTAEGVKGDTRGLRTSPAA